MWNTFSNDTWSHARFLYDHWLCDFMMTMMTTICRNWRGIFDRTQFGRCLVERRQRTPCTAPTCRRTQNWKSNTSSRSLTSSQSPLIAAERCLSSVSAEFAPCRDLLQTVCIHVLIQTTGEPWTRMHLDADDLLLCNIAKKQRHLPSLCWTRCNNPPGKDL